MKWRNKERSKVYIAEFSNVIQYDEMGYPSRLVILSDGEQQWLMVGEGSEKEDDVVLKWTKFTGKEKFYD